MQPVEDVMVGGSKGCGSASVMFGFKTAHAQTGTGGGRKIGKSGAGVGLKTHCQCRGPPRGYHGRFSRFIARAQRSGTITSKGNSPIQAKYKHVGVMLDE